MISYAFLSCPKHHPKHYKKIPQFFFRNWDPVFPASHLFFGVEDGWGYRHPFGTIFWGIEVGGGYLGLECAAALVGWGVWILRVKVVMWMIPSFVFGKKQGVFFLGGFFHR